MNELEINEYYYLDGKDRCRVRDISKNKNFILIEFDNEDEYNGKESIQVLAHRLKTTKGALRSLLNCLKIYY